MIFRLISSQLGSPSPDYGSHIIMSISGIFFTYINPHIILFSSPILNSGARNNINNIHNISGWIYVCCRQQPVTNWRPPAGPSPYISCSFTAGDMAGGQLSVASESADQLYNYLMDSSRRSSRTQCPRSRTLADVPTSLSAVSPAHQCAWSAHHVRQQTYYTYYRSTLTIQYVW